LENIIQAAVQRGASDLHIKAGDVFRARINGDLKPLTKQRLTPEQTRAIALKLIPHERDRQRLDDIQDYDCSWGLPGVGRFRVNILRQRGSFMIVMRVIPIEIPTFDQLGLPQVLTDIAAQERGLVLVTGVTGSGKSSTQAAMIGFMNQNMRRHVVTLENPIEFLHRDINCHINQREVGTDTASFGSALRRVLRQDPDVVLLGEIRDLDTLDTALKAADTGHLVFSTLHTTDATQTINRVLSFYPPHQQAEVRFALSTALAAVISLRLVPRTDRPGRVPAAEVLINTAAVREQIRDLNATLNIPDLIKEGTTQYGMQSFDQSLMQWYTKGVVSYESALFYASSPSEFALRVSGVSPGEQEVWQGAPETLPANGRS
jgi:twitching motility protein PilT